MRQTIRKIMRRSRFIAGLVFPVLALAGLLTRSGAVSHAQGGSAVPAKTPQYVTYQSGTAQWLSAPHTLSLSQGVQFGQDDAVLKTEAAVALLDKDQNLVSAKAQGPVHLYDTQDDLTGRHGSVDFTKHIATLQDGIVLVVRPGKRETGAAASSPRKQFKDPATLTCAAMTYDYRYKIGRIPGPLTVTQVIQTKDNGPQTRTLTADAGLYNGKAQTIQLVGSITGAYSDGSVIQGDTRQLGKPVVISIKEGAESIFVPFKTQGHFPVNSSDPKTKGGSSTDDNDDGPDLTLPVPPPHAPGAAGTPLAPAEPPADSSSRESAPQETAPEGTAPPAGQP